MNYIKIFQSAQGLSVSVGNNNSKYQLMHLFSDNFHQCGEYSAQMASHQVEIRRERKFNEEKSLTISSLQSDYLNLDRSSVYGKNNERGKKCVQTNSIFVEVLTILQTNVSKG